jgi:hypothetical protein
MLHDLKDLIGSSVTATDGEMGKARDFLFDDHSWLVSYLIVDVGTWFKRRGVVLPVASAEHLDWTKRVFRVRMTREQGRHSPDVDTEKPVSRQQEIARLIGSTLRWKGDCRFRLDEVTLFAPRMTRTFAAYGE